MTVAYTRLRWRVTTLAIIATATASLAYAQTNQSPAISGTPATTVAVGNAYTFKPSASDANGDPLTFTIANRPTWAMFNANTGALTGTPTTASIGGWTNIIIKVSDGRVSVALPAFAIAVTVNAAPTISGAPPTTAKAGAAYAFTPTAKDVNGDPLTFSILNKPTWAAFNAGTGAMTGTPTAASVGGWTNIIIRVSDGMSRTALPAFGIAVSAATANQAPTISGTPKTTATVGTAYAFTPAASDANGDPLTFTILNKPTWANFSATTGALTGTPTAASVGGWTNIIIRVSDGPNRTALPAFAITVSTASGNTAPTISGTPKTTATVGTAYAFTPTASDANGDPLTFTILNKPTWANFSATTGALTGTPTAASAGGWTNIIIRVSDGKTTTSLTAFAITVSAAATNGSVTLSWQPPTQNTSGSALTDLAGYKVYWGTSQGTYPNSVTLNNPGLATYVVSNLTPGTYFFVMTAVNKAGAESVKSNAASKTIQ